MPTLDPSWKAWIADNLQRGCALDGMVDTMVNAGFDRAFAAIAISEARVSAAVSAGPYHYDPAPIAEGSFIDGGDRQARVLMRAEKPQVVVLGEVLSHEECDEIIRRAQVKIKRSTIVDPHTGKEEVVAQRSSEGTFFERNEDDFIAMLDRRVAKIMNWPLENGEGFQILRYGVGGEYRPHFDYFPPADPGSARHLAVGGQRVGTMVLYLNEVERGGETTFPDAGLSVAPHKGGAVYFRYGNSQGQVDPLSLHAGAPILAGEKWIMTKWMRERRYGV